MNNQIKTYPIKLSIDMHKALVDAAYIERISMQQFILQAIQEKIQKGKEV